MPVSDLPLLGNAGVKRSAVHDLVERIPLRQRAEREFQIEGTRRVAVGGQDGRVGEKAVFGRHFAGLQRQQVGRNIGRLDLKLIGAGDQRVAFLVLGIQRARAGEGQGLPLRLEGALVSGQQRVGAGNGRVQLHHVAVVGLLRIAGGLCR